MDVCDLQKEHFDLFFAEHMRGLSTESRNHYRGSLHLWLKWCARKITCRRNIDCTIHRAYALTGGN
jgi:hypothetical protein